MAPIRIRSAGTKVAVCVVGSVVVFLGGLLLGGATGADDWPLALIGCSAWIALVVFCARTFRGPNETDAPRAWWRMTGTPVWAYAFGALFLTSAFGVVKTTNEAAVLPTVTDVVIAIAFVGSAVAQTRRPSRSDVA